MARRAPWQIAAALLAWGGALAFAGGQVRAAPHAQLECPDNRLTNGGFESGFGGRGRVAEIVGNGWTAWYERFPGVDGINYVPDFTPAEHARDGEGATLEGLWSQRMTTEGATHTAGLWQRVAVPPGSQVLVQGSALAWATDGDDRFRSEPPGTYALSLGLDPLGGDDPNAPSIVWTDPITVTDTWVPLVVELPVDGASVTVFTRGQPLQKLHRNESRWDSLCLRVLGPVGEPTPTFTRRPWPTRTPGPEDPTPTRTPVPTEDPAVRIALEVGVALDAAATATRQAEREPSPLPVPDRFATLAAGDTETDTGAAEDAPLEPLGPTVTDRVGLVFFALAALAAGLVLGLSLPGMRARDGDEGGAKKTGRDSAGTDAPPAPADADGDATDATDDDRGGAA